MKFAKELEQELVPEWRIKYLNYKAGKKYVKAVSRAISKVNGTPSGNFGKNGEIVPRLTPTSATFGRAAGEGSEAGEPLSPTAAPVAQGKKPVSGPQEIPARAESQSLTKSPGNEGNYGSFVPTPPSGPSPLTTIESRKLFELPDPAIRVSSNTTGNESNIPPLNRLVVQRSQSMLSAVDDGRNRSITMPRPNPIATQSPSQARLRRLFSTGPGVNRVESNKIELDVQANVVRQREQDFFNFLDNELDKVETFYKQKEQQAGERLTVLREQLHEMRIRRTGELAEARKRQEQREDDSGEDTNGGTHNYDGPSAWIDPIKSKIFKPGPNSKALMKIDTTASFIGDPGDAGRDYVRRTYDEDVPYRTAKRKLKLALQEFYRGLELLKSYTLLNRTAFRKLNKKYDKAVHARPPYRYMNEKVSKAWFVNSDIVDGHIKSVEDIYARYFEKGNHKIAAGKLRRLTRRPGDESGSTFLNGLFIGTGAVFSVQGLVYGAELLFDPDTVVREQTLYLMQIYGGYFLMLFLFSLFCLDCYVWTNNKINYPFIFEFDTRHNLDWRQLAQFPSFCLLLLGIFIWLNFTRYGSPDMYLYYPVILIFLTLLLILLPVPILAHRSRKWFAYSHWRLLLAGLYPVEFRDFFLGDIYCSLTYATCNIELFFCLYAHYWNHPSQCNSNHSRLLGFFYALPPIWRALQCIRRYLDTKNIFPHLVNCGKYIMTIMAAITLSLYRIHGSDSNLALFATFSVVNSLYTSVWDILMDFSLLQPDSRHPLLRDILALKRRWVYYVIMTIDPIIRFAWIFYTIFTYDKQHSTIVSFFIGFAEVLRRGMWALLRVENEHCGNVAQYKASRDTPLPYHLEHEPLVGPLSSDSPGLRPSVATATSVDIGAEGLAARPRPDTGAAPSTTAGTPEEGGLRRRRKSEVLHGAGGMIRKIMAEAHKQDFEKKRRPPEATKKEDIEADDDIPSEDEEDDEDEDNHSLAAVDERMTVRESERLVDEEGEGSGESS